MSRRSDGFTLLELLISITVLTILAALSISALNGAQRGSRDSKRKADLAVLQSALEQYRADQGSYPPAISPGSTLQSPDGRKVYLRTVPSDPSPSSGYNNYCYLLIDPRSYELFANLEKANSGSSTCSGKTYNLKMESP